MAGSEPDRLTWDRWIPVFRPHLEDTLTDRRALAALGAVARGLPGDCLGALEVRLGPRPAAARARVDLAVRLERSRLRPALSELAAPPALRAFLERWAAIDEVPPQAVPALWLEYDLGTGRPPAAPLRCARLGPGLDPAWLTDRLLPVLCDGPPPEPARRLALRCLRAVPAGVRPLYLFDLRPRGRAAVRIELFATDPRALIDYLGSVAPAPATRRVERLAPLVRSCERFHLSLDLGARLAPRIGLEAGFRRPPDREPGWSELLEVLVAERLCDPRRGASALRWPGCDSLWTALRRWPGGAGEPRPPGFAVRCLSHLKLVSTPGATELKGYLLFQHLRGRRPAGRGAPAQSP